MKTQKRDKRRSRVLPFVNRKENRRRAKESEDAITAGILAYELTRRAKAGADDRNVRAHQRIHEYYTSMPPEASDPDASVRHRLAFDLVTAEDAIKQGLSWGDYLAMKSHNEDARK